MNRKGSKDTASVAASFKKLYEELPLEISIPSSGSNLEKTNNKTPSRQMVKSIPYFDDSGNSSLKTFLKEQLPRSDQKEINEELKKTFPLHKQKGAKIKKPQPKRKGKYLTAHERRRLGLNRLPKVGGLKVRIAYRLS